MRDKKINVVLFLLTLGITAPIVIILAVIDSIIKFENPITRLKNETDPVKHEFVYYRKKI